MDFQIPLLGLHLMEKGIVSEVKNFQFPLLGLSVDVVVIVGKNMFFQFPLLGLPTEWGDMPAPLAVLSIPSFGLVLFRFWTI